MGAVAGKDVLCLAAGGGQQSAAFALLWASVTVVDLAETQLERDREALMHYALEGRIEQGDMRDLSRFADAGFDVVWHGWSINFIPDTAPVFDVVRRVLRPGGLYRLQWGNPFSGTLSDRHWTGTGYQLTRLYADGEQFFDDPYWEFADDAGTTQRILGPREFTHTLSTVVNGLLQRGLMLRGLWEETTGDPEAALGTWEHVRAVAPHDLTLWAQYSA
jgi:SAM-dependent methyltransferase